MKRFVVAFIIPALTVIFILAACPRVTPKVGIRKDLRVKKLNSYITREFEPARRQWQMTDRVIDTSGVGEGDKVGLPWAGAGYFLEPLSKAVGPKGMVYASDYQEVMLKLLEEKVAIMKLFNVKIIKCRREDPQLPFNRMNFAFVVNVQEYIDMPYAFFDMLRRGMKTGGKVIIVDWRKKSKKGPKEKLRRSRKKMVKILQGMHYKFLTGYDFLPHQYFLVFRVIERYGKVGTCCGA